MLAFLQQPYVFAFALAMLTATITFFYSKTVEKDQAQVKRTFFKTLAAGVLAGAVLAYFSTPRGEQLAAEPFDAVLAGGGGANGI